MNKPSYMLLTLIHKLKNDDIFALASQLSYSLLLSFFPFLIFLMSIVGLSSIDSEQVLVSFGSIIPDTAYDLVYSTVNEIISTTPANLLSFSLLVTVWISSTGFTAVIKGLNKAYGDTERRSYFAIRFTAILCTFGIVFLIILSLFVLVLGNTIENIVVNHLDLPIFFNSLWIFFRYLLTLVCLILIFCFIYKVSPYRNISFSEVIPGAIFATCGWVVSSMCFAFYVDHFGNYSRTYGSIGAVIILMLWLFISSIVILIGGEINALLYNG